MIQTTLPKKILEQYMSPYFFETGTADGDAVRLALEVGYEKIFTIEIDENLYKKNCELFKKEIDEGRVLMFLGDTLKIMDNIVLNYIDKKCTFWLDAHQDHGPGGVKRCPLMEELNYIRLKKDLEHTILIDDRRMFGQKIGDREWWGTFINENDVINSLKELNEKYVITLEDSNNFQRDIICARI